MSSTLKTVRRQAGAKMSINPEKTIKSTSRLLKKECDFEDAGPTPEILTHGEVEKFVPKSNKRGPIMAKRTGMHERLYARGKIDEAQWSWACRYVRETEISAGARPGRPEFESAQAWAGPLIYNRQCAAAGFLRRAHELITAQERLVLIAACVNCAVVVDLGPLLGLLRRPGEASENFKDRISGRVTAACVRIIGQASGVKKT